MLKSVSTALSVFESVGELTKVENEKNRRVIREVTTENLGKFTYPLAPGEAVVVNCPWSIPELLVHGPSFWKPMVVCFVALGLAVVVNFGTVDLVFWGDWFMKRR